MKTVKEVSSITGISVRTLHYYDEIGLFKPTECSEAGYRLYDEKALETLQQILFFREFDMPLKDIRDILNNPAFDRETILRSQRKLLECKRDRLNRLLNTIDNILKGDNNMSFEVFHKRDIEEIYELMVGRMKEEEIETIRKQYGDLNSYREKFLENAGSEKTQQNYQKMVEWYGSKEKALDAARQTPAADVIFAYQKRSNLLMEKLAANHQKDPDSLEIRQIVGEMDFVYKQIFQMEDVTNMMLEIAVLYQQDEKMKSVYDERFGEGASWFIGEAITRFYRK